MTVTAGDIKTRFPDLASIPTATIDQYLAEAGRMHSTDCWGDKSDDGLAYLTAHFLVAFAQSGEGAGCDLGPGPLTNDRVGQVSSSWSPLTVPKIFAQDDLGTTKYGRRYLSLRNTLFCCRCT